MKPGSGDCNCVVLAAGGTGGHIYPAIALGSALRAAEPSVRLHYVCGNRDGEAGIYRAHSIQPTILPLSGRRRGFWNHVRFAREMMASYRIAARELRRIRPNLALGFGSYLSLPVLLAARRQGISTAIHEQNATAGFANRFLARSARLVMTGTELDPASPGRSRRSKFPKDRTRFVGNPVREELLRDFDPIEAKKSLGLPLDSRICLCFGGSQGSAGVNRLIIEVIELSSSPAAQSGEAPRPSPIPRWHFLWITGPSHFDSLRDRLGSLQGFPEISGETSGETSGAAPGDAAAAGNVTLRAYVDGMAQAYAAADLVIARAGALTLAELTALGKPSILIPLPRSAGDHQRSNAERLAARGAAIVIDENDPGAARQIKASLAELAGDGNILDRMGKAARALGTPNAAREMAEAIRSLQLS